jgi:hypothetical protein
MPPFVVTPHNASDAWPGGILNLEVRGSFKNEARDWTVRELASHNVVSFDDDPSIFSSMTDESFGFSLDRAAD